VVVHLPWLWVVATDVIAWAGWSALAGWGTGRWTRNRAVAAEHDGPVLRMRAFETGGRWYERRLRVKGWKGWLPEAGRAFGGRSKRHLPPPEQGGRRAFLADCRKAERTHWLILAVTPLFAIWNPPGLFAAMVVFALVANGPCLVVLRYNRARLLGRRAGQAWAA
jgi:glycosyl-4,4'-diaponeurosporenoate acyltransferase